MLPRIDQLKAGSSESILSSEGRAERIDKIVNGINYAKFGVPQFGAFSQITGGAGEVFQNDDLGTNQVLDGDNGPSQDGETFLGNIRKHIDLNTLKYVGVVMSPHKDDPDPNEKASFELQEWSGNIPITYFKVGFDGNKEDGLEGLLRQLIEHDPKSLKEIADKFVLETDQNKGVREQMLQMLSQFGVEIDGKTATLVINEKRIPFSGDLSTSTDLQKQAPETEG